MPIAMSVYCLAKLHRGSVPIVVSLLGVGLELSGHDVGLGLANMVLRTSLDRHRFVVVVLLAEVLSGSN